MEAKQGQSFLDLVLQGTGALENAFAMSLANGKSITDDVVIGEEVTPTAVTDKVMQRLLSQTQPATAVANYDAEFNPVSDGIGVMIIEETFIVR